MSESQLEGKMPKFGYDVELDNSSQLIHTKPHTFFGWEGKELCKTRAHAEVRKRDMKPSLASIVSGPRKIAQGVSCNMVTRDFRDYRHNVIGSREIRRSVLHVAHRFPPGAIASPTKGGRKGVYCQVQSVFSDRFSPLKVHVSLQDPITGAVFFARAQNIRLRSREGARLTERKLLEEALPSVREKLSVKQLKSLPKAPTDGAVCMLSPEETESLKSLVSESRVSR